MKKLLYLVLFVMLSFTINVSALSYNSSDLKNRKECSKIELATANADGSLTKVECFDDYTAAKNKMKEMDDQTLVILERKNDVTKVIDAKYALVYLQKDSNLTNVYSSSALSTEITYMYNNGSYGGTDGAFLEINYSNKAAKIRIAGVTGWIKSGRYEIIPVKWVKSYSYYKNTDKGFYHYYAKNIENTGYSQNYILIDDKQDYLANGNYRSFDGIYFYSDFYTMTDDYRENKHDRAVNKDNPYYNYYQYLPHRSKTNYDIEDFDAYIRNYLNFKGSIYGKTRKDNYSVMYGTAEYYENAEKLYGANALSIFSLARHESGNGRSDISVAKNNLFGHNAVDGSAFASASGYLDGRSSIYNHGYSYINYGYARVSDWRYNGSHFGNKNTGMNVQYASDVYWGEKAGSYYYSFDKSNGFLDKNYYQLIISTSSKVNVRTSPKTSSTSVYTVKKTGIPFVLIEEVHGETVGGSDIWYKIQSDTNVSDSGSIISTSSSNYAKYNWTGYLYVHSSYFKKINTGKTKEDGSYYSPMDVNKDINSYTITSNTNAKNTQYTPEVGLLSSDTDYYYTMNLTNKKGTILKNSYVVILEKSVSETETNYLVLTDYSTNQKAWISSKNVRVLKKDLVSVNISTAGGTISVLDKPGGTSVLKVYDKGFLPIVDKVTNNGKLYLKVLYKIVGTLSYGYVDSTIANITYTTDYINIKPVITASNQTIIVGDTFNPLEGVTASDNEDGNITKNITVTSNTVNINKAGTYEVVYSVTDSFGETVTKKIQVTVVNLTQSDALFMYNSLKHIEGNTFNFSGFIGVKGMDNKTVKQELIFVNELTKNEYTFPLTKWNDYPYEMSSITDTKQYDYSGAWFNTNIDLSKEKLPNGNYSIYVRVVNGTKEAKSVFTNVAYMEMTRRAKGNGREYMIDIDYSTRYSPLVFSVRDSLISLTSPKTLDPMYNFFTDMKITDNKLTIKGTSHSVGVSFGNNDNISRKLILENTSTFERYEYEIGSINNGDYEVTLVVSDNKDKTRAWYNSTIDLSNVSKGNYVVYIKNTVNGESLYGELIDVAFTDFSKINSSKYNFKRNDNARLRVELEVK